MNDERLTKLIESLRLEARGADIAGMTERGDVLTYVIQRIEAALEEDPAPAEPAYDLDFAQAVAAMREGKTVEPQHPSGYAVKLRRWGDTGMTLRLTADADWVVCGLVNEILEGRYRVVPEETDNG